MSERYIRQRNYVVRRPQAESVPESWGEVVRRHWPEIVYGVVLLLTIFVGLPWALGLAAQP